MNEKLHRARFPLMALAILALLAAIWGGLLRLGWLWPALLTSLPMAHGPLMVSGFLGTLIGLERAVALSTSIKTGLKRSWMYVGPLFSGVGALLLILGVGGRIGPLLITLGSLVLLAIFGIIVRRHFALYTVTMGLGALAWLIGNALWLFGWPVHRVVLWWAGFLVLTIAGERLELARILRPSKASRVAFLVVTGLFLAGLVLNTVEGLVVANVGFDLGTRLAGLGMIGLALWLLRHDVARHTVRKTGLTRFIAVCLLVGYVWLAAGGLMSLAFGGVPAGPRYDAWLHAIFLGFVLSMIFGHAPIVFPAVLGVPLAYDPTFYFPLILLQLSLVLRIGGDLSGWWTGRQLGGLLNAVAILLFLVNTVRVVRGAASSNAESRHQAMT
jgi:hypothetical protein